MSGRYQARSQQRIFCKLERKRQGHSSVSCGTTMIRTSVMTQDERKSIHCRGLKYPERVMNYSKIFISVMFSGNGEGNILPPYTVYKAEHLWETWCTGGPKSARFNRRRSGWFDGYIFSDWFMMVFLPTANKQNGIKIIIGDNLSRQLCHSVKPMTYVLFFYLPTAPTSHNLWSSHFSDH